MEEKEQKTFEDIPFVAFGNDELANKPALKKTILCKQCGKRHKVRYADEIVDGEKRPSTLLAFYNCGEKSYLAGIGGKEV